LAPELIYEFVNTLRHQNNVPLLVLIDNLNAWDSVSQFIDAKNAYKPLPSRRLALVDAWSTFQHLSPCYGASMFSTTSHASTKYLQEHFNMHKVRSLFLPEYSYREFKHALVHYHVSGVILSSVDDDFVGHALSMSGALPKEVFKLAQAL